MLDVESGQRLHLLLADPLVGVDGEHEQIHDRLVLLVHLRLLLGSAERRAEPLEDRHESAPFASFPAPSEGTARYVERRDRPQDRAARFLQLHARPTPLLIPNPWDAGSAKLLASLGFEALATTSSGFAATLGRLDGGVTPRRGARPLRRHRGRHRRAGVGRPRERLRRRPRRRRRDRALAIDDRPRGLLDRGLHRARRRPDLRRSAWPPSASPPPSRPPTPGPVHLVLTARAENLLRGRDDLADTIARLQAYQEAGADVLYAPGLHRLDDIRAVVSAVDRPVNVLALPSAPSVAELAAARRRAGLGRRCLRLRRVRWRGGSGAASSARTARTASGRVPAPEQQRPRAAFRD